MFREKNIICHLRSFWMVSCCPGRMSGVTLWSWTTWPGSSRWRPSDLAESSSPSYSSTRRPGPTWGWSLRVSLWGGCPPPATASSTAPVRGSPPHLRESGLTPLPMLDLNLLRKWHLETYLGKAIPADRLLKISILIADNRLRRISRNWEKYLRQKKLLCYKLTLIYSYQTSIKK